MSKIKDKMIHSLSADKIIQDENNQMIPASQRELLELLKSKVSTTETEDSKNIQLKGNIIDINIDDEGSGVSDGIAGIRIFRGDLEPYCIVFDETDGLLKIGTASNLQSVASKAYVDEQIRLAISSKEV